MSDEMLVRHCSPTLAGLKTGSMFSCGFNDLDELRETVRAWNRILVSKGLCMLPLKYKERRALIYIYRPERLASDLSDALAQQLLTDRGYSPDSTGRALARLIRRFAESEDFPHEVGLFLGYPPEDVRGFIENRAHGYKCIGAWKVYGDADKARRTFERYHRCTEVYCRQWSEGKSVENLTVAG